MFHTQWLRMSLLTYRKQTIIPREYNFNATELLIIDNQLEQFLDTGVIEKVFHSGGQYISNIFIRPKKHGSYRLILNLKCLSEFWEYHHFKNGKSQKCYHL